MGVEGDPVRHRSPYLMGGLQTGSAGGGIRRKSLALVGKQKSRDPQVGAVFWGGGTPAQKTLDKCFAEL